MQVPACFVLVVYNPNLQCAGLMDGGEQPYAVHRLHKHISGKALTLMIMGIATRGPQYRGELYGLYQTY
jgi:hypothetical protein